MNNSRKYLREISFVVLFFTALSFIKVIGMAVRFFVGGLDTYLVQADVPKEFAIALMIGIFAVSLILLVPQLYVGMRGIKAAKGSVRSKGHIVWSMILLVFAAIGAVSAISNLIGQINVVDNIILLVEHALDVIIYCLYFKYANQVLRGA